MALGVALAVAVTGIGATMTAQVNRQFGADVQVSSPRSNDGYLDAAIMAIPGASLVSGMGYGNVRLEHSGAIRTVSAMVIDPDTYFQTAQLPWVVGADTKTPADLQSRPGVLVPASLASQLDLRVGDSVSISAAGSTQQVPVVGTFASLATGTRLCSPDPLGARWASPATRHGMYG